MNRLSIYCGNVYYPTSSTDDLTGSLGKYGLAVCRHLQQHRPDLYRQWQSSGYLNKFLLCLDARYETWKIKMVQHLKEHEYTQNSIPMGRVQSAFTIEAQADSLMLALLEQELKTL